VILKKVLPQKVEKNGKLGPKYCAEFFLCAMGDHGFCLFAFFDPSPLRCPLYFRRKKTFFFIF
jgi:hypothetical protein